MRQTSSLVAIFLVAIAFLAGGTQAQAACPNPPVTVSPLQLIDGSTWVFHTEAGDYLPPGMASIGRFTATYVAGNPAKGILAVNEVSSVANQTTRGVNTTGRYQIYPDCSGGTLSIMTAAMAVQYEFVFANNFTEMNLVSMSVNNYNGITNTMTGRAVRLGPAQPTDPVCPANPLQLSTLNGVIWSFRTSSAYFSGTGGSAAAGTFLPAFISNRGALVVNETLNQSGAAVARLSNVAGRYSVNPDCSGGTLQFMLSSQPVQFDFFFTNTALTEMYLLSSVANVVSIEGIRLMDTLKGEAKVF